MARREGTVYRRKAGGRWEAALSYRDERGSYKRARSYHDTEEEADLALARMRVLKSEGTLARQAAPKGQTGRLQLKRWLAAWLRDAVAPRVSPRTLDSYEMCCRVHVIGHFGEKKRVDRITPREVESLDASMLRAGYSLESRRKVMMVFKKALRQAEMWGDVEKSPAAHVPPPRPPHEHDDDEEEVKAYTEQELSKLFAVEDRFRELFVLAARTGLRQGELLALRWSDVDLRTDPATLAVRRSLASKTGGGYYFTPLKSRRQRRRVFLHREAAEALERQREETGRAELVFPSARGTPMNARNVVNRHYIPALEAAGVRRLTFHALRHTFASIALYEWQMPVQMVSELLGHANTSITLDRYAHLSPGTHESEIVSNPHR